MKTLWAGSSFFHLDFRTETHLKQKADYLPHAISNSKSVCGFKTLAELDENLIIIIIIIHLYKL